MDRNKVVVLRLAYLGWNYYGTVRQEGLPTVESALSEALMSQGIEARIKFTSRTDKGVSALDNLAYYRGPSPNLSQLNFKLPRDIVVWAVSESERAPKPEMRVYAYRVPFRLSDAGNRVSDVIRELKRTGLCLNVEKVDVKIGDNYTHIEFHGKFFKRHEIRKAVGMMIGLSVGRKMDLAPPEGLVLVRTVANLEWREFALRKLHILRKIIEESMWRLESTKLMYELLDFTFSSISRSKSPGRTT